MSASPLALALFALLILGCSMAGMTPSSTGLFPLLFILFVPAYVGISCLSDWLKWRNRDAKLTWTKPSTPEDEQLPHRRQQT